MLKLWSRTFIFTFRSPESVRLHSVVVYTFAWQASLTHFQLQTQIPFGVMPGRASTVKVCQIKHAELPTVVPHCEKGAAESSFRSQQSTERHVTCMGQAVMFFSALCGSTFQVLSAKCSPSDDDGGWQSGRPCYSQSHYSPDMKPSGLGNVDWSSKPAQLYVDTLLSSTVVMFSTIFVYFVLLGNILTTFHFFYSSLLSLKFCFLMTSISF